MNNHPFDRALALTTTGAAAGRYQGQTTQDYWNMVGPYGGITAAALVRAVQSHPLCLGDPLSITVNYAAALGAGRFDISAEPVRTNRSSQHWLLTVTQADDSGDTQVVTTATAVTAVRRNTWGASDLAAPQVAPAAGLERAQAMFAVPWLQRYDMRFLEGGLPGAWDGHEYDSLSRLWVRDEPPRALDFCALAAISDVFFPRIWLRRAQQTPAGTVSITVYFHASQAQLAEVGEGYVLAQARGQEFRSGFFDHTAQLWSEAGVMLASSHQIVYFKE